MRPVTLVTMSAGFIATPPTMMVASPIRCCVTPLTIFWSAASCFNLLPAMVHSPVFELGRARPAGMPGRSMPPWSVNATSRLPSRKKKHPHGRFPKNRAVSMEFDGGRGPSRGGDAPSRRGRGPPRLERGPSSRGNAASSAGRGRVPWRTARFPCGTGRLLGRKGGVRGGRGRFLGRRGGVRGGKARLLARTPSCSSPPGRSTGGRCRAWARRAAATSRASAVRSRCTASSWRCRPSPACTGRRRACA